MDTHERGWARSVAKSIIEQLQKRRMEGSFAADAEQALQMRRQGLTADVFIASTNAITLDGRLVNLDATGNRLAAMI